jgi:hypothetical protein
MINLKSLLTEEKEAFVKEREGKISFSVEDTYNKLVIFLYVSDFDNTNPAYAHDPKHNTLMGRISLTKNVREEEWADNFPKPNYLFIGTIVVNVKHQGYGYLLYKEALKMAQKLGYRGLSSMHVGRSFDADDVWNKLKTFSDDHYDYVDIKDLGTRLKERKLTEAKSMDTKEGAADYLIRKAWRHMDKNDKYDSYQLFLWIDNEHELSDEAWKLAKKFYPTSDEAWYDFQKDIEDYLYKLEQQSLKFRRAKTPDLQTPINVLKGILKGKSWEAAKRAIYNQLAMGNSNAKRDTVPDEDAEAIFNRLYKNAMGETVYNQQELEKWGYGRLDQLKIVPVESSENPRQYMVNVFIRHYGSGDRIAGKVRVWRGTNSPHSAIRPGDFVTFERGYAEGYQAGKWKTIVTDVLDAKDLLLYKADPGTSEMVYWPEGHEIKKYEGEIPSAKAFWHKVNYEGF